MPRRLPDATAVVVVAAGVAATFACREGVFPALLPLGSYPTYDAATPRAEVLLAPVMHAPWFGALPAPLALAAVAAVLAALWVATRRLGAGAGPAAVIVLAAVVRPEFATALSAGAAPVLAVALTWVAIGAIAASASARLAARLAASAAAAATLTWPPAVVLLPAVLAAGARAGGWGRVAVVTVSMAAGVPGGAAAWAARAAGMAGEPVSIGDVMAVATLAAPAGDVPYPWPPLTAMLLPMALAVAGGIALWTSARSRAAWLVAVVVIAAAVVVPSSWRDEGLRAIAWSAWPLAAVGLQWLVDRASPPRRAIALGGLALVLIGSGVLGRVRQTELVEPRAFAAGITAALEAGPAEPVVVAEDGRIDTALVAWGGRSLRRLQATPDRVEAAAATGAAVLAGPTARASLELWGLRFAPGPTVDVPVPFVLARVAGGFHCVEIGARWSELPGLDYTGRLGAHLPPGTGHLEVVIVGPDPMALLVTAADGRPRGAVATSSVRDLAELPPVLWPGDGRLLADGSALARATVPASSDGAVDVALALGARAPLAGARVVGGSRATICAAPLPRLDPLDGRDQADAWRLPLDDGAYIGAGWRPLARGRTSDARVTDRRGVILVPSARARAITLAVDVERAGAADPSADVVSVAVNGVVLAARPATADVTTVEVQVPASLWMEGTNEIALSVATASDSAERRLVVRAVRLSAR